MKRASKKRGKKGNRIRKGVSARVVFLRIATFGLYYLFGDECRWSRRTKGIIFSAVVAAAVAMTGWSLSFTPVRGGVELANREREVEIYGPKVPAESMGYSRTITDSGIISNKVEEEDDTIYVYALEKQTNYHDYQCKYAYASAKRMTVYEAYYQDFKPCRICNPPIFNPRTGQVEEQ